MQVRAWRLSSESASEVPPLISAGVRRSHSPCAASSGRIQNKTHGKSIPDAGSACKSEQVPAAPSPLMGNTSKRLVQPLRRDQCGAVRAGINGSAARAGPH